MSVCLVTPVLSPNSMRSDERSCGDLRHETMEGVFHSSQDEFPNSMI